MNAHEIVQHALTKTKDGLTLPSGWELMDLQQDMDMTSLERVEAIVYIEDKCGELVPREEPFITEEEMNGFRTPQDIINKVEKILNDGRS